MPLKLISAFCQDTGYTEKAVRHKMTDGTWVEGREFVKAPDGRLMVDTDKFDEWARSADKLGVSTKWQRGKAGPSA
ncbi:hypothetical protein [Acidovorax phage ACPWH]|nr:hypothetical protein [Acidovorax phage ACPWH]QXV72247.1 hypothetical protein Acf1_00050 [Acidovorax phage ACF1]